MEKAMEYILQVDSQHSFSKAAECLFISQPALSAIIRKEELRLGVQLFDRSVKPVKLTEAGIKYITAAKKIQKIEAGLLRDLQNHQDGKKELVIGSSAFFFVNFINKLKEDFSRQRPQITYKCIESSTEAALHKLQKKELDMVITAHNNHLKDCGFVPIRSESIVLAVPAAFDINRRLTGYALTLQQINSGEWLQPQYPCVPLAYFENYPFILHKKSKDMYKRTVRMFHKQNMRPRVLAHIEDFYTLYFLARSGQGIVFLRDSLLKYMEPTAHLIYYKINDPLTTRNINIYYRKDNTDALVRQFIDFCVRCGKS